MPSWTKTSTLVTLNLTKMCSVFGGGGSGGWMEEEDGGKGEGSTVGVSSNWERARYCIEEIRQGKFISSFQQD